MNVYGKILILLENIKQHPLQLSIAIIFYVVCSQLWGGLAALFVGTFVLFALLGLDTRVFIFIGLFFLATTPFYLFQRKELMAEQMAIYAYYSLSLGICLQIVEYIKKNRHVNFKFIEKFKCLKYLKIK